jgi:hypothetical protein
MPRFVVLGALAACAGGSEPAPQPPAPAPAVDAGAGITAIGTADPNQLDRDPKAVRTSPPRTKTRPPRPVDVMLRTTPVGAMASVDGIQVGLTPIYWLGDADGREHEFTFVLQGYAVGRYRFVPMQSGVVHARLTRTPDEALGSGAELVAPPPPVSLEPPPAPLAPIDAPPAPAAPPD